MFLSCIGSLHYEGKAFPQSAFSGQRITQRRMQAKKIFIISDATGQSGLHILRAAIVQFERSRTKTTVFHNIDSQDSLIEILDQAKSAKALIAFTFVKKEMREYTHEYCLKNNMFHLDILGPLINNLSSYLRQEPLENPTLLRKVDERYFKRIDAIEFTIDHDDGRGAVRLREADIVIIGLSRTSKTPTSFFLAQEGFKVANVPIVKGIPLPDELFTIDQHKIICFNMDPAVLQKIRMVRQKQSGLESSYGEFKKIFDEVEYVWDLTRRHRNWKVIDTTNKSIEETAWEIIRHIHGDEHDGYN